MRYSFAVGSIRGIEVRFHVLFVAIVVLLVTQTAWSEGTPAAIFVGSRFLLVFGFVLLHELGHSVAAQRAGMRVHDIVLWPLGGLARLEGLPATASGELRIAVAGPLVNFALAALLAPVVHFTGDLATLASREWIEWSLLEWALVVNLGMGTFNLVPAFPLDGGRVLRALLAIRLGGVVATRIAVGVGRGIALIGAGYGMLAADRFGFVLLAVFVWILGTQELSQNERRARRAALAPPDLATPPGSPAGGRGEPLR
jgi:Zn-dependent protease